MASPQQFNHCIIAVKVSDETQAGTIIKHPTLGRLLIFDPTDEQTPLGDLAYDLQGSLALIDSKNETDLVRMPVTPPEMNQLERTATLELRADGGHRWKDSDQLRDKRRRSFARSFETFETGIYRTHRTLADFRRDFSAIEQDGTVGQCCRRTLHTERRVQRRQLRSNHAESPDGVQTCRRVLVVKGWH